MAKNQCVDQTSSYIHKLEKPKILLIIHFIAYNNKKKQGQNIFYHV